MDSLENLLEKADNNNDRFNIVLLKLKEGISGKDKKRLDKLEQIYPDNEAFYDAIKGVLYRRGMINVSNAETYQDDKGDFVYVHPELPKLWYTTEVGEKALKNNLFPSEFRQKSIDKRFGNLQAIGIFIAAIGGLITIFTLIYKLIQ